ncbi:hypothetical protein OROGR_002376 [Orobanche gracilis]
MSSETSPYSISKSSISKSSCESISKEEVKGALIKIGRAKAVGPDQIPIEVWLCLGEVGVQWLAELFNILLRDSKMSAEWRRSIVVPFFKNKGDAQSCTNYRGIKLLSHTLKLWERVVEGRVRRVVEISENQFGFMPGRSTTEAIHLVRRLMEKFKKQRKDIHMVFIDLEKAYDSIPRDVIWRSLEERRVSSPYIRAIQDMYSQARTCIRTPVGGIQDSVPWCMLFADDIVLVAESRREVNAMLELWRSKLESQGLRVSRSKTEYLWCNFSGETNEEGVEVMISDQIVPRTDKFKYLGSIIQKEGEFEDDVIHRIKAGWLRWRAAIGVLCDKKVPLKLKGKFYRAAIRPAMLYGSECWAMKKSLECKLEATEMRILRWSCGRTLLDRIPNGVFRSALEVAPISAKVREERLRWFGHVRMRQANAPGLVRRANHSFVRAEFIENVVDKFPLGKYHSIFCCALSRGSSRKQPPHRKSRDMVCVHLTLLRPCSERDILGSVFFADDRYSKEQFSGFPELESLSLHWFHLTGVVLKAPKLRFLQIIRESLFSDAMEEISAPLLTSFRYEGYSPLECSKVDLPSLEEVFLNVHRKINEEWMELRCVEMFQQLGNAKIVALTLETLKVLEMDRDLIERSPPPFPHMKCLKVVEWQRKISTVVDRAANGLDLSRVCSNSSRILLVLKSSRVVPGQSNSTRLMESSRVEYAENESNPSRIRLIYSPSGREPDEVFDGGGKFEL